MQTYIHPNHRLELANAAAADRRERAAAHRLLRQQRQENQPHGRAQRAIGLALAGALLAFGLAATHADANTYDLPPQRLQSGLADGWFDPGADAPEAEAPAPSRIPSNIF